MTKIILYEDKKLNLSDIFYISLDKGSIYYYKEEDNGKISIYKDFKNTPLRIGQVDRQHFYNEMISTIRTNNINDILL